MQGLASVVLALVSYVAGLLTGIFAGRYFCDKVDKKSFNADLVLVVVTIIWALSMVIDIISPQWETPIYVHGLMGAIVGFFYRSTKKEEEK